MVIHPVIAEKMGRCKSKSPVRRDATNKDTKDTKDTKDAKDAKDAKICRFCFDDETESNELLFTPCKCSGSSAYVHPSCLDRCRNSNSNAFWRCQTCQYEYTLVDALRSKHLRFDKRLLARFVRCGVINEILATFTLVLVIFLAGFVAKSFVFLYLNDLYQKFLLDIFNIQPIQTWYDVQSVFNYGHWYHGAALVSIPGCFYSFMFFIEFVQNTAVPDNRPSQHFNHNHNHNRDRGRTVYIFNSQTNKCCSKNKPSKKTKKNDDKFIAGLIACLIIICIIIGLITALIYFYHVVRKHTQCYLNDLSKIVADITDEPKK